MLWQVATALLGVVLPAKARAQEEPAPPESIVWVCLKCDRAFGEQAKALDHHTKKRHRLSKRRVE